LAVLTGQTRRFRQSGARRIEGNVRIANVEMNAADANRFRSADILKLIVDENRRPSRQYRKALR
jgi:hypothetical protein